MAAYATVGFTALVYEVAWTRTLSMVLGSSIYAFAAMLAAFLLGIALGSMATRTFVDRLKEPRLVFAWGIALLGLLSVGTMWILPLLPDLFAVLVGRLGLEKAALIAVELGLSIVAMLPPTLVLGALFPILARALTGAADAAPEAVGRVYFANTIGSATGAFMAGFVLIPGLGLQGTMILATAINLATAGLLLALRRELPTHLRTAIPAAAALVIAGLVFAPPSWNREGFALGAFHRPTQFVHERELRALLPPQFDTEEILFYREGLNTTVSVHRWFANVSLNVNGKPDASSIEDMPTQVLSGQIPMLFGRPAKDVLVVGWASGVTVGSVVRHPVERVTVVELEPEVVEASHYFREQNGDPLGDPRVHLVLDDGRTYLGYTPESFDVIISEPSNPWMTGAASLFTREHLQAARARLRPGGRYLQWVQLYGMDAKGLRSILRTIDSAFPYVYAFAAESRDSDLILMATLEPLGPSDLPHWPDLSPAVRDDLVRVGDFGSADLWSLIRMLPEDLKRLAGSDVPLNTDDNMFIELRTPRLLYRDTLEENWNQIDELDRGVLPLLETTQLPDPRGRVALSYALARRDYGLASALARGSTSAHALAARVETGRVMRSMSPEEQSRLLERAIALEPQAPLPHLLRAQVHMYAGSLQAALDDLDVSPRSETRARDPRARGLRGALLRRLGRVDEAVAAFEGVLASSYGEHPAANPLRAELAFSYGALGRPEDQIRLLEEYLERGAVLAGTLDRPRRGPSRSGPG